MQEQKPKPVMQELAEVGARYLLERIRRLEAENEELNKAVNRLANAANPPLGGLNEETGVLTGDGGPYAVNGE